MLSAGDGRIRLVFIVLVVNGDKRLAGKGECPLFHCHELRRTGDRVGERGNVGDRRLQRQTVEVTAGNRRLEGIHCRRRSEERNIRAVHIEVAVGKYHGSIADFVIHIKDTVAV